MPKITDLPAATTLAGTEPLPVVQAGQTKKTTAQDLANLVDVSGKADATNAVITDSLTLSSSTTNALFNVTSTFAGGGAYVTLTSDDTSDDGYMAFYKGTDNIGQVGLVESSLSFISYSPNPIVISAEDEIQINGEDGVKLRFNNSTKLEVTTAGVAVTGTLTQNGTALLLTNEKAAVNGIATLDGGGKVPTAQLPGLALTDVYTVASQAAQLALTAEEGDIAIRSDQNKTYAHNGGSAGTMADWSELLTPTDSVTSVNGQTGAVTLVKGDVGLGNVDNTSDAGKPVSTAQQTALDLKANLGGATFSGDISVPDEAYDATAWNGSMEVPTKNAVRDKFESLSTGSTALQPKVFTATYRRPSYVSGISDTNSFAPNNGVIRMAYFDYPGLAFTKVGIQNFGYGQSYHVKFAIYAADATTGAPSTLLYSSSSLNVDSGDPSLPNPWTFNSTTGMTLTTGIWIGVMCDTSSVMLCNGASSGAWTNTFGYSTAAGGPAYDSATGRWAGPPVYELTTTYASAFPAPWSGGSVSVAVPTQPKAPTIVVW